MERFKDFFRTIRKHFRSLQKKVVKEEPHSTLVQNIPDKGLILDAGSGDGQFARMLNKTGRTILCLDIKAPKKRNPENEYILGSVEFLPFKKEVIDFTYSMSVLEFVKNDEAGFDEFHRTLKAGRRLVFTVPTKYSIFHLLRELELFFNVYEHSNFFKVSHYHYYSKTRIKQISSKKFSDVKIRPYDFNFFPRFMALIGNLWKKNYPGIRSKPPNSEENTNIEDTRTKYPKESPNNLFFRIFEAISRFFTIFAYHYVVVAVKK